MGSEFSVVRQFLKRQLSSGHLRLWLRYITETATRWRIFFHAISAVVPQTMGRTKHAPRAAKMGVQPATSTVEPVDRLPNRLDIEVPVDEFAPSLPEFCSALNSSLRNSFGSIPCCFSRLSSLLGNEESVLLVLSVPGIQVSRSC
jgi:hypothetical protein